MQELVQLVLQLKDLLDGYRLTFLLVYGEASRF